jgi:hypothetical protein
LDSDSGRTAVLVGFFALRRNVVGGGHTYFGAV